MGAIIVSGKPVGFGINKHSPGELKNKNYKGCGIHAEIAAIINAGENVQGSICYVAGISKGNNRIKSKPCSRCHNALTEAGIKRVYYYEKDGSEQCLNL